MKDIIEQLKLNSDNMFYFYVYSNTTDITLYHCGYEQFSATTPKIVANNYPYYTLHCVLSGTGWLEMNGKVFSIGQNQLFCIPPNVDVKYGQNLQNPWTYIWINFGGVLSKTYNEMAQFSLENPVYTYKNPEIEEQFYKILESHAYKYSSQINVFAHVYKALGLIIEERGINIEKNDPTKYINEIVTYIENNYHNADLSLNTVASILHLHPKYFCRLFHKKMGCSFIEYLNMLRIKKAAMLLKTSSLSIKQISFAVGFDNPLYFSRVFKNYCLLSPKNYRLKEQE